MKFLVVILLFLITASLFGGATTSKCPCSDPQLCKPILTTPKKEVSSNGTTALLSATLTESVIDSSLDVLSVDVCGCMCVRDCAFVGVCVRLGFKCE